VQALCDWNGLEQDKKMKVMFVEARSREDINNVVKKFREKGRIGLVSSVQYLSQLEKAQKLIPDSIIAGQVLGCKAVNTIKIKKDVDNICT